MDEYSKFGHTKLLNAEGLNIPPNYFLPHHAVKNENNSTAILKVVLNTSAKTPNGQLFSSFLLTKTKL